MRVESPIGNIDLFRLQHNDTRVDGSNRISARANARFSEVLKADDSIETSLPGVLSEVTAKSLTNEATTYSAPVKKTTAPVTEGTRAVAAGPGGEGNALQRVARNRFAPAGQTDRTGEQAAAPAPVANTADGREAAPAARDHGASSLPVNRPGEAEAAAPTVPNAIASSIIHTPLGPYDPNSRNNRLVTDVVGSSSMEVYFITHAPGEWMRDAAARSEFVKIYGADALVTVDRHGTVPKNIDPTWVTKSADAASAGRA
jgi:hypothetical protein